MTSSKSSGAGEVLATERAVGPIHAASTGFLMGLANLVPGLSGGTMVLIMGLYERFVGAIAEVTSLKLRRSTLVFLALFGGGAALAIVGCAKVAVYAVVTQRMASFALFVGLTLGVVPELWRESRPGHDGSGAGWPVIVLAVLAGFGLVVGVDALDIGSFEMSWWLLAIVGAIAASSMILPGVSGSYVLLLFGVYELVMGSISVSALRETPSEVLGVLVPVGIGVAVGMGAFSNVLKFLLDRASRPTHAALLGLVLGSVVGLWPFQELVHQELGLRDQRKAIEAMVIGGETLDAVRTEFGVEWTDEQGAELGARFAGMDKTQLKLESRKTNRFAPSATQIGLALALAIGGFLLTRVLARVGAKHG